MPSVPAEEKYPAPREFRPLRRAPIGRHPLLEVFPGFTETAPFRLYPGDPDTAREVAGEAFAQVTEGPGWMYIAPRETPLELRAVGIRMVESAEDTIVVARDHLANSASMDLYLDLLHEFLHLLQRRQGRELWPGAHVAYVDRPTEIEAYSFSLAEARRLGVPDDYLRDYLRVGWIGRAEYLRLLRHLEVAPPPRRTPRRNSSAGPNRTRRPRTSG